jgi:integrase
MKRKLTPAFCRTAKPEPGAERSIYWDIELRGFGLAVTTSGQRTYVVQYRFAGRSRRMAIGGADALSLDEARAWAMKYLAQVKTERRDPLAEKLADEAAKRRKAEEDANTLKAVAERYLATEATEKKLRSLETRRRDLERLVYPKLGASPITAITRKDIRELLDNVAVNKGPVASDRLLALLSTICNWYARQDDAYTSPIIKGMARTSSKARARDRILTDDEIRAVWAAAEAHPSAFGALVMFLLLTGARRCEASAMRWEEIDGEGNWTLPACRNKTKLDLVRPLSPMALAVIEKLPRIGQQGFVFTNDGRALAGFSKPKRTLDQASGVRGWRLHDLRRTSRSLLSRAGVSPDHGERCLGHVIVGTRGVYDRWQFHPEKKQALEALAALLERILNPQANVVPLRSA